MSEELQLFNVGIGADMRQNVDGIGWTWKFASEADAAASNGTLFESSGAPATAAQGVAQIIGIETGDNPILIDSINIGGVIDSATVQIFTGATYTGGTALDAFNGNDVNINTSTVNISLAPTVTDDGDALTALLTLVGAQSVNTKRYLKPNTKYIFKFINLALTAIPLVPITFRWIERNA